jgi:uncharacterized membrane protein|tara:strand:- start:424 stop:993 length:570 start_codon:yes stop_codon:yes gene_type:complete
MMAVITAPLAAFLIGLTVSVYLLIKARDASGEDGTIGILNASMGFSAVGIMGSGWTWSIHNSMLVGSSSMCATEGLVQCGSVIGDPQWNNLFGIPWGLIGIASFALIWFLILSLRMDLHAKWASKYVDLLYYVSLAGVPFVLWLVIVELTMVEGAPHICPYCTVIHAALLGTVASAYYLRERKNTGSWS